MRPIRLADRQCRLPGLFGRGIGRTFGEHGEALRAINQGLARADTSGELQYQAELIRIKGEVLLRGDPGQAEFSAEEHFRRSGEMARGQGALFWELRSAVSFARLRMTQGRRDEAKQILAPVLVQFTEGFGTPDLRAAKTLPRKSFRARCRRKKKGGLSASALRPPLPNYPGCYSCPSLTQRASRHLAPPTYPPASQCWPFGQAWVCCAKGWLALVCSALKASAEAVSDRNDEGQPVQSRRWDVGPP